MLRRNRIIPATFLKDRSVKNPITHKANNDFLSFQIDVDAYQTHRGVSQYTSAWPLQLVRISAQFSHITNDLCLSFFLHKFWDLQLISNDSLKKLSLTVRVWPEICRQKGAEKKFLFISICERSFVLIALMNVLP